MNAEDPMETENGFSRNDEDTPLDYDDKVLTVFHTFVSAEITLYVFCSYFTLLFAFAGGAIERVVKTARCL